MADEQTSGTPGDLIVRQGDFVSKIAAQRGFRDFRTIWEHARNQTLRQQRTTPNVLLPGDSLFVPVRELRTEFRPTDARHRFVLSERGLRLRLIIKDMTDRPVAGKPCDLKVTGSPDVTPLATDGRGMVDREIKPDAEQGKFVLKDAALPIDLDLELRIGHLDPIDSVTGAKARLNNLAYFAGEVNDERTLQFRSAVEEFQCDHKLAVDGVYGPKTQAALKDAHGC